MAGDTQALQGSICRPYCAVSRLRSSRALSNAGVDIGKVQLVAAGGINEGLVLLRNGTVDAAILGEPLFSREAKNYTVVVDLAKHIPALAQTVGFTTRAYAAKNADKIRAVKEKFSAIFQGDRKGRAKTITLTKMQIKVLNEIIEGKSTAEIAKSLFLSENTINTHIKGIYSILGVHSRAKAVKMAMDSRLITDSDHG